MRLFALFLLAVIATGCETFDTPPDTDVETFGGEEIRTGRVAIVVSDSFYVDDLGGVNAHIARTGDPAEGYRAFFEADLVRQFAAQTELTAFVAASPEYESIVGSTEPVPGERVVTGDEEADYVLFLDRVRLFRAKYQTGGGMMGAPGPNGVPSFGGSGTQRAIRHNVDVLLWDNTRGARLAKGRVESEETLSLIQMPSRGAYTAAIGEIVEKLADNTQIVRR